MFKLSVIIASIFVLSGCEYLKDNSEEIAMNNAKAIGAACRQIGTPLVDCYTSSPKIHKGNIFAGWKEMDAYMRDNKIPNSDAIPKGNVSESPTVLESNSADKNKKAEDSKPPKNIQKEK